jgi:hypothetical protein
VGCASGRRPGEGAAAGIPRRLAGRPSAPLRLKAAMNGDEGLNRTAARRCADSGGAAGPRGWALSAPFARSLVAGRETARIEVVAKLRSVRFGVAGDQNAQWSLWACITVHIGPAGHSPKGMPDAFPDAGRIPCQWPSSSPHPRPRISPVVAIFSPRWRPRISPPTDRLVVGVLVEGLDPLAGGRLGESVAVLPVGDQDVGVMKQAFDGRGGEAFWHQLVEPGRVNV